MRIGKTKESQEPVRELLSRIKLSRNSVVNKMPSVGAKDLSSEANLLSLNPSSTNCCMSSNIFSPKH